MKKFTTILSMLLILAMTFISSCDSAPSNEPTGTSFVRDAGGTDHDAVVLSPTWGQSFSYAAETGYTPVLILGLALIALGVYVAVKEARDEPLIKTKDPNKSQLVNFSIGFLLLVAASLLIYIKPGNIKFNNDKKVKREVYEKVIKETGTTQPIWDSLKVNNLIIGAAQK